MISGLSHSNSVNIDKSALTVSVAMATYNGGKYILEQLISLATQTVLPFELVVTDDGSTDQTLDIIADFALIAPFVVRVYRNKERLGYGDNFIKAMGLCSGELIALCDQDDVWVNSKIERCVEEFYDSDVMLCVHSSKIWSNGKKSKKCLPYFKRFEILMPGTVDPLQVFHGFSMIFRRIILEITNYNDRPLDIMTLGGNKKCMAHDQWVWFIASIFGKIAVIPDVLCLYRQHDENLFGAKKNISVKQALKSSNGYKKYKLISDYERDCVNYIDVMSKKISEQWVCYAKLSIKIVDRRAQLHNLRANIYNDNAKFSARLVNFWRILYSNGYFAKDFQFKFGSYAIIKDIFYGITGLYRYVRY